MGLRRLRERSIYRRSTEGPNDEAIKASQQCLNPAHAPGGSQEAKEDVFIEWRLTSIAEQLRMAMTLLIQSYASRHPLPLGTRYPSSPQHWRRLC